MKRPNLIVCLDDSVDFEHAIPEILQKSKNQFAKVDDVVHLSRNVVIVDRLASCGIYSTVCAGLSSGNLPYISLDIPSEFALVGKHPEEAKTILEKLEVVRFA